MNQKPSSVFYTRSISFTFTKLISQIETYEFQFSNDVFDVKFDLKCSMVDGKTCHILTEQDASNCCNLCGVSPTKVNNIKDVLKLTCNKSNYQFGFSVLHSWIRFMEYMLHISYNLDFQKS